MNLDPTFKLISMIAALEDKAIDLEELVDTGNGEITFIINTRSEM